MIDLPGPDAVIYAGIAWATLAAVTQTVISPRYHRMLDKSRREELWPYLQEPITEEKQRELQLRAYTGYSVIESLRGRVALTDVHEAVSDPATHKDLLWWLLTGGRAKIYPSQI